MSDGIRLATWNIHNGAPDTYDLLIQFAKQQALDVLCVQEANGWHLGRNPRLKDFAKQTGLSHSVFGNSNTPHKVIIYSRFGVVDSHVQTAGFFHCAVQAVLDTPQGNLGVATTHLHPTDRHQRLREAKQFVGMTKNPLSQKVQHMLLFGDYNNPSRYDNYSDDFFRELVSHNNLRYGSRRLRYDVIDYFAKHGFVDPAVVYGTNENTFPATSDEEFPPEMRFDYGFVPQPLVDEVNSIEVVKDELTQAASDHFPVVMEIGHVTIPAPSYIGPERLWVPSMA